MSTTSQPAGIANLLSESGEFAPPRVGVRRFLKAKEAGQDVGDISTMEQ